MARYKIAVDARPLCYGFTGNSRYLYETLRFLVRENSEHQYILLANKNIHPVFSEFLDTHSSLLKVHIQKMPGFLWLNFWVPYFVKKIRANLFWGTLQLLPVFQYKIPQIVNYHDLNFVSAPATMTKANYWQHKLLSGRTLQNADRVICLSQNTYTEITNFKPSVQTKLSVIYPGVRQQFSFDIDLSTYGNYLLAVGTLEPRKNIQTLIKAFLSFKEKKPKSDLNLVIAGRRGWGNVEFAHDLINQKYEKQGLYFVENPDENTLSNLYQKCSAFLFPSFHEGFGLPIIEAMSYRKVCAVSDIPVFREIVETQYDQLVDPTDIEGWEKVIHEFSFRPNLQRQFGINSKLWSWQETAAQIETEIAKCLFYKNYSY
jgi:glycosyltransferase involved in cell wall biosynthesis